MRVIEINRIIKSFAGRTAVNDLTFAVEQGEIMGLIGPNGAGKTTTIRMIMDSIKPDNGEIKIFGGLKPDTFKDKIGYLPEEKGLYKKIKVIDAIIYLASLKGMERRSALEKADDLLDRTGMYSHRNKKIEEMSKGMGQVIQFIVTIIHDPEILILDEPFSGLDPV